MGWSKGKRLRVTLAAVAVAGAGIAYLGTQGDDGLSLDDDTIVLRVPPGSEPFALPQLPPAPGDSLAGPDASLDDLFRALTADPNCKPGKDVAEKYQKEGYKGLAYGWTEDNRAFFLLTDKDNKKWALITPDEANEQNVCVKHEGQSFETAQPTGRLMLVSAEGNAMASIKPAVYVPVSSREEVPFDMFGFGDAHKILSWLNSNLEQSTVFKGDEGNGRTLRILASKDSHGEASWSILESSKEGMGQVEDLGRGFHFAKDFKPPMKHLE